MLLVLATGYISCNVEDGVDGQNGVDGVDGEDGTDGEDGADGEDFVTEETMFSHKSPVTPLIQMSPQFGYVDAYTLMTTTDAPLGDNGFKLAGSADGAGFLKNESGDGYIYIVNCEDSYAVARIYLDENLNPVSGDYLLNSEVADYARQCSGTMWEKEIHGGSNDLFLSASEDYHYTVKGIDPRVTTPTPSADFGLDALGQFQWENAVPLPKETYSGATVIIGGDDNRDPATAMGQLILYYSQNGDDDLQNGKIYVLRLKQVSDGSGGIVDVTPDTMYDEGDIDYQTEYEVEFVEIEDGKNKTYEEMGTACLDNFASQFMRIEDVDYQKGADENARNIFFAVTGRGPNSGVTMNNWGTVYKLVLDDINPLEGKLTQIVSGNVSTEDSFKGDGELSILQSPDNLCVTENFVYIQEDPNSENRGHTAYIYQTNLNGYQPRVVMEAVVRQDLDPTNDARLRDIEYGALTDISDKIGVPDTFILAVQPHYWQDESFLSLDGHFFPDVGDGQDEDFQASQLLILKGLPR
ncbi:hypothetical protein GCM10022393_14730 [Aquimarina addita]|uniref:Phytase-like domain-containing protein n=2 Tax=Aquimarina addita TaxID=870485 RepID=A0ABP7XG68_9FLAO